MFLIVFAQGISNPVAPEFSVGKLISSLIGGFIIFAFIAAFFYLLWGGFSWITSGGNPEQVDAARNRIIQALIGLVLVIAAWFIMQIINSIFFEADLFSLPIPSLAD